MSKAKKKVHRLPVAEGVRREMCSGRVDPTVLAWARKACKKKYKKELPSMLETILINEFGAPKIN